MYWDYFLQSVGLQEQEKHLDTQIDDKGDEDGTEDKVSPKFGSSSKVSQQPTNKKRPPKTKGTPSSADRSATIIKEESPQMQLRSSTTKRRENKGRMCYGIQQQTRDIPEIPFSPTNVEDTQVTPTKNQGKLSKMRGHKKEKKHTPKIFNA